MLEVVLIKGVSLYMPPLDAMDTYVDMPMMYGWSCNMPWINYNDNSLA